MQKNVQGGRAAQPVQRQTVTQGMANTAPTPLKRIAFGVIGLAVMLLLGPFVFGEYADYCGAKNRQDVTALLSSYTWKWDARKEQYEINAAYRWEADGHAGTFCDTQYSSRPVSSAAPQDSLIHEGKENDPPEVRPLPSVTLHVFQQNDGRWKALGGNSDPFTLILGYAAVVFLCAVLLLSGIVMFLMMRRRSRRENSSKTLQHN